MTGHCPRCAGTAVILMEQGFVGGSRRDVVRCSCGWRGRREDLVEPGALPRSPPTTCERCFAAPPSESCVTCAEENLCTACWDGAVEYSCCLACLPETIEWTWNAATPYGKAQMPECEPTLARARLGIGATA